MWMKGMMGRHGRVEAQRPRARVVVCSMHMACPAAEAAARHVGAAVGKVARHACVHVGCESVIHAGSDTVHRGHAWRVAQSFLSLGYPVYGWCLMKLLAHCWSIWRRCPARACIAGCGSCQGRLVLTG
jgi:hypothetical protein